MRVSLLSRTVMIMASVCVGLLMPEASDADPSDVRTHAEQSFERLTQADQHHAPNLNSAARHGAQERGAYSPEQYLIGKGQGEMTKGPIVCQRVSELSARTDLAKQIRILVKEHMVDRVRERSGKDVEQDIEITREEIVQEYLQGVKIVDRQTDEEKKLCSATAVMPKNQIQSAPATELSGPGPTVIR